MSLVGDLLSNVLADVLPAPKQTPAKPRPKAPACPAWVSDKIRDPHGVLALAKAQLDGDVDAVVQVAGALCRHRRLRDKTLARRLNLDAGFIRQVRHALAHRMDLAQLGKSWAPDEEPGTLSRIVAWNGRQPWLTAVSLQLLTPQGKAAINRRKSTRLMVLRVARQDAAVADGRSGRGVRTAHQTLAKKIGYSAEAVRHARYVLEDLGLSVTVTRGRYLTTDERAQAHATHGGRQRRIASTRALTMPRHLPRSGRVPSQPQVSSRSPRHARASARPRKCPKLTPVPLAFQKLAGQVAVLLPHLAQNHIGNLARALSRLPIDPTGWTGHTLLHLIQVSNRQRGRSQPTHQGSGIGLFIHQVRTALAAD